MKVSYCHSNFANIAIFDVTKNYHFGCDFEESNEGLTETQQCGNVIRHFATIITMR